MTETMRKLLFNLHLWAVMITGIFLIILGATGAEMIFEEQIDRALNPSLFSVTPQSQRLPLAELIASVQKTLPGERVKVLTLPQSPDLSAVAMVKGRYSVFVDPYTGQVKGTRKGQNSFTQTVHMLHLRLLMGETGGIITTSAAIVLVFLTITGIYLWWPLKRVTIARGKSWRRFNFDLHHAVGFYSSVFLLILSFTGVLIGFEETTVPAMYKWTNTKPTPNTVPSTPVKGATPITPDQAIAVAGAALPGTRTVNVGIPPAPKASYRVAVRYPEDRTPGGRSRVIVNQFSGKVLLTESSRTAPAGTRLVNLNRALHTGDICGWPSKIFACLVCLALLEQIFSGVVMWWKRRGVEDRVATAKPEEVVDFA